ncbi:MAG TPA: diphthine--ammonia ligase [Bacteroidales bacterium]|nr:diphthine--ammonia ligase [Bacteroidales bacterium]
MHDKPDTGRPNTLKIPKAIFCWSGGKDSAYCLHKVLTEKSYDVKYLLTTINEEFHRISMHGVREELLEQQAESIGIPLLKVYVSEGTNAEYEKNMESLLLRVKEEGITDIIFGDIFLEDLRAYRENNLAKIGMNAVFPLWKMDTKFLIRDFINQQFKTIICCTNDGYLGKEWSGREIDKSFPDELPSTVDPCGENGEYHTFCYDGPLYKNKINVKTGESIYKALDQALPGIDPGPAGIITKGFWYCELVPEHE